jgi:DNA-directed RNA polymerase subunit beta
MTKMQKSRYFLSDFVEIQRQSFFELLENGIIAEFSKRNPITSLKKDVEIYFYPEYYKLTMPEFNPRQAILRCKSYTSKLYMPVQLTYKKSNTIRLKWAYIGNLPLMTKRGHFILNGAARVIVNQIIRSPGIYYQEKLHETFNQKWSQKPETSYKRYYADLICLRGTWLRLEIDKEKNIWAQTKKGPKIPVFWFLIAMGLSERVIFNSILEPNRLTQNLGDNINSKLKKNHYPYVKNPPTAWKEIYSLISTKKTSNTLMYSEQGRKWLYNKFMNPRAYDLSKQGRSAFNRKLGLNIDENQLILTPQDLLFATDYLIKVEKGLKNLDDIDHLKNRRVRTSGELIQIQIGIALVRLEKSIREKMNKTSMQFFVKVKKDSKDKSEMPIFSSSSGAVPSLKKNSEKKFSLNLNSEKNNKLQLNHFSDFLDFKRIHFDQSASNFIPKTILNETSSLKSDSKLVKRKKPLVSSNSQLKKLTISNLINNKAFNSALREFFGTSPLSQFMDQINPLAEITHKRRLSSMGPGGVTRDTATLAIRGIHPTHYGRICPIETPEGKNTGLVNSMTTYARVNALGILESPFYKVYKGLVLKSSGMFFLSAEQEEKTKLAAADLFVTPVGFLPNANIPVRIGETFTKISRNNVEYIGISPLQMISIATSLIPFLEHDDANRALMGSNMQRQAVPLIRPERPIVGTGLESRAVSDSGHVIQSKFSGVVTYVSAEKIKVTSLKI